MEKINLKPILKYRRFTSVFSLVMAIIVLFSMDGLLNSDIPLWLLVNLSVIQSASSGAILYAAINIFIVFFGVILLLSCLASFVANEDSHNLILAGMLSIIAIAHFAIGANTAFTLVLIGAFPAILLRVLVMKYRYKTLLGAFTLYYLALFIIPIFFYLNEHMATFSMLPDMLLQNVPVFVENYEALISGELDNIPQITTYYGLSYKGAIQFTLNLLPTIFVGASMLCSFFMVTYSIKNRGILPLRMNVITRTFKMSKEGAAVFLISGLAYPMLTDVYGVFAFNLHLIMTLPLAIVGSTVLGRLLVSRYSFLLWVIIFFMVFTMPLSVALTVIASVGAINTLFHDKMRKKNKKA